MGTELIEFIHDTKLDELPPEVIGWAKRAVLDLLGVAAAGRSTALASIIANHAVDHFGGDAARILFDGRAASAPGAALANGMLIDSLDAHDGYKPSKGHIGCGVFASVLALAEATGQIDDLITPIVVGYEIGARAGTVMHAATADYHTSGASIAPTAAALGARLLGLTRTQTRHAIGIGEYHGPRSQMMRCIDHPTMVKDGSGWGAMAGVSAAYLARDGFTGAPAVTFEDPAWTQHWDDLGDRWLIAEQYFKPYPVCRWAQPVVVAAIELCRTHELTPERIDRIEVATFHESLRLATRLPATTEEAQYSTAFPAAVAAVFGDIGPGDVDPSRLDHPDVRRLAESMVITERDDFNAVFPGRRISEVTMVLDDGTEVSSGPTEAIGEPEDPVDDATVMAKFIRYCDGAITSESRDEITAAVDSLGTGNDAALFAAVFTPPNRSSI